MNRKRLLLGPDVLDALPDAIITADVEQKVVWANAAVTAMFGWQVDDLIGRHINELIPERFRGKHVRHVTDFIDGEVQSVDMGSRASLIGLKKDGSELFLEGTIIKNRVRTGHSLTVILRDISERKLNEQRLIESLQQSEAANRMKSEIMSTMSHELRTPLNAVIGFSELMEREIYGEIGDERYRDYVRYIKENGVQLLELINSILCSARIEADRVDVDFAVVNVAQLVRAVVNRTQSILVKKEQKVEISVDEGVCLLADIRLLRHVLTNLLSNASKFSGVRDVIRVESHDLAARVAVDVVDNGCGIPADSIKRLGHPFVQAHMGPDRKAAGVGLGLYIVRSYLDLHQAALAIASVEGQGTSMRTCWPSGCRSHAGDSRPEQSDAVRACRLCFAQRPQQHCSKAAFNPRTGSIRWKERASEAGLP